MKKLAQGLLVDVSPEAHQGEFEKPDHGRRQDIGLNPVFFHIKQDGPLRQIFKNLPGFHL